MSDKNCDDKCRTDLAGLFAYAMMQKTENNQITYYTTYLSQFQHCVSRCVKEKESEKKRDR
jgi:hypothetical protein